MENYTIQFASEAEFVDFKKTMFEKEIAKIERKEQRMRKQLQELREKKKQIMEEFKAFKQEYPAYFRRGRKKKND
ncbi:MAG: hypothetical protein GXO38_04955 [Epsilonproteobacteria bacterium]|nr:hypothetical protein [Campylobacterota bacterium]